MASLNKVMLIGRLTDNPEPPRVLPNSGSTVVKFRFAVSRNKKNAQTGQWDNDPNPLFIDCEAFSRPEFGKLTELISQYCKKGSQIFVEGRLQLDQWDDKTSGQKRSKHKLVVERIEFLDTKNDGAGGGGGGSFNRSATPTAVVSSSGGYSSPPQDDMGSMDDDGPPPSSNGTTEEIPF